MKTEVEVISLPFHQFAIAPGRHGCEVVPGNLGGADGGSVTGVSRL